MKALSQARTLAVSLLSVLALAGLAAAKVPGVRVVKQQPLGQGLRFVLSVAEPEWEVTAAPDGRSYSRLTLRGCGAGNAYGQPALPIVHHTCKVPAGMKCRVAAIERNHKTLKLPHPVWPAQRPLPKRPGAAGEHEFLRDASSYAGVRAAGFQKASDGELRVTQYRRRGQDYVDIVARPFAYHAQKGELRYPAELVLDVTFTVPDLPKAAGPRPGRIVVLEMPIKGEADLQHLVREGYSFERRRRDRVEIYATEAEAEALREAGFNVRQIAEQSPEARITRHGVGGPGHYHDYASMTAELEQHAADYPNLCRLESIGQSVRGRELWAIKITESPDLDQDRPRVRLASTMHGDEPLGTEMCLYLIDMLLGGSRTNARLARLVASTEVWVLPLLNPDGLEAGTRFNASGYDLNRAFPDGGGGGLGNPVFGPLPGLAGRPPEVISMMRFSTERTFALAANFHTGALVVNYPYDDDELGNRDSPTPDDDLFELISHAYASNNPLMRASATFPGGIVNGAVWYSIDGSMQDWHYRYAGCNEVTIELSERKTPPASRLASLWDDNREAILDYLETVHTAIRGTITDAGDGQPLPAAVKVLGVEHPVVNDPQLGHYHRMLLPGTYHLLFTAPGYETLIQSNVVVHAGQTTRLDVMLERMDHQPERIILATCESLRPGLQGLKTFKEDQGYRVQEVVVADGTNANRVRSAIRNAYSIFPAEYILLLGDVEQIPSFYDGHTTDLPYALIDSGESFSDYLGRDAVLGRLPAKSTDEIDQFVLKLGIHADSRVSGRRDFAWISHGYSSGQYDQAERGHDWCIANSIPSTYNNTRFYRDTGSAAELTAHVNAGTDGVIYSGHGFSTRWVRYDYGLAALTGLSNAAQVPIVFGHCCNSGAFGLDVCFAEGWLQTSARGVTYVGATDDTYWGEDELLQKTEFEAMRSTARLSVGKALEQGLLTVHEQYPDRAQHYFKVYHVLGDPTLIMFDAVPSPLEILTASDLGWANTGIPLYRNLRASGGTAPYTWSAVGGSLPPGISLSPSTGTLTGIPRLSATNEFTIQVSDAGLTPQFATQSFALVIRDLSDIFNEAADTIGWQWDSGGDVRWDIQSVVSHDGVDAAASGTVWHRDETWLETTIEGPGIVTFWWKVSSARGSEYLRFKINGSGGDELTGEVDWQQQAFVLDPGPQTVRWSYRDSGGTAGLDRAWVDQVEFIGDLAPIIVVQPRNQSVVEADPITIGVSACGAEPVRYQWFHNGLAIVGAIGESLELAGVSPLQAGGYNVVIANGYGSVTSATATLTVTNGLSLAEAVDAPDLVFLTGHDAPWVAQTTTAHDGVDAVEWGYSRPPVDDLQTTVDGPGSLSFWWKVSSETNYGVFNFSANSGQTRESISGEVDWQQQSFRLEPGPQRLRWYYRRMTGTGHDRGWLDGVSFVPDPLPPTIVQQPHSLRVPQGWPSTLRVLAAGPKPLLYQWDHGGVSIPHATDASHVIGDTQPSDAGQYRVTISNDYGAVTSDTVLLDVAPPGSVTSNLMVAPQTVAIPLEGEGTPYPAPFLVSGLAGVIRKTTITLNGLSHPNPRDLSILLAAPSGDAVLLMANAGYEHTLDSVALTFDDDAQGMLPQRDPIVSGTYRTSDFTTNFNHRTVLPAPAPRYYAANLSSLNGLYPNGSWKLYVCDEEDEFDKGMAATADSSLSGWSLTLVTAPPPITNLSSDGETLCFQFRTEPGRQYAIEYTDALREPSWTTLRTFTGNGTVQTFTLPNQRPPTRFYRMSIQASP